MRPSETVIALEGKPISAYPFRLFLLSPGPTYGQDITSKAISKLVNLPREWARPGGLKLVPTVTLKLAAFLRQICNLV